MKKIVIYKLNGKNIDEVIDLNGDVAVPEKDEEVTVKGKRYRSLKGKEWVSGAARALPIYTVYLQEI